MDATAGSCAGSSAASPGSSRAFDLPTVLGTWGAGLPPEHIHVVTVPPAAAARAGPALATLLRGPRHRPGRGRRSESDRTNPSLGVAETQVLRQLNRRLGRAARDASRLRRADPRTCSPRRSWSTATPPRSGCRRTAPLGERARRAVDRVDRGERGRRRRRPRRPAPAAHPTEARVARPRPGPAQAPARRRARRAGRDDPRGGPPPDPNRQLGARVRARGARAAARPVTALHPVTA